MSDIKEINGVDLCASINGVNPKLKANIMDVNSIVNNCSCSVCSSKVRLSYDIDDCVSACNDTNCGSFYTDGNCLVCPLVTGDYLYLDSRCTSVADGYYSPNKCMGGCNHCYEVVGNVIMSVSNCTPSVGCDLVDLYQGGDGKPCEPGTNCGAGSCDVCKFTNHLFAYTNNGTPSQLSVNDKLFKFGTCNCHPSDAANNLPPGIYRHNHNGNPLSPRCIEVNSNCTIVNIGNCGVLPS